MSVFIGSKRKNRKVDEAFVKLSALLHDLPDRTVWTANANGECSACSTYLLQFSGGKRRIFSGGSVVGNSYKHLEAKTDANK